VPAQGGRRRRTRAARADPTSRPHAVEPEAPPSSTPRPAAVELPYAVAAWPLRHRPSAIT
jgi:hypothetical protein